MMRWFSALCLLAAGTSFLAAEDKKDADDKNSARTRVISLIIRKPLPGKPGVFAYAPPGVTMDVVLEQPGKFIVAVDAKQSKLDSFTDDKENNLYRKAGLFGSQQNWINEYLMQFSPDGAHCTVQLTTTGTPGKGAQKILVKGALVLKCGADEKTTEKKDITLKTGEEVLVGDFRMTVNNAGQFGAGLNLFAAEPKAKSVEFFDADGKKIEVTPSSRGTNPFGPGGKPQAVVSYFLTGKRDKVSFKVTYFDKVEAMKVPLDLRVGLDLE